MSASRWRAFGVLLLLVLSACRAARASVGPSVDPYALAYRYAPILLHGAASDQDFPTRVDFDGDWVSNNNWENQPQGDLRAFVYYAVMETETHWFVFYSIFHPRDYTPEPCPTSRGCHENDLESLHLAILKDGTPDGRLQAMTTLAHGDLYLYTATPEVQGGYLKVQGPVQVEDGRPVVYIESYGHGIYGHPIPLEPSHVRYRVGEEAQRPSGISGEATYQILDIYDTLWARRHSIGPGKTFDRPFRYWGRRLPAAFDGDTFGEDKANTPWGYIQGRGWRLHRGDWFLDPARAWAYHARFSGPFSFRYRFHPYRADLGLP